MASYTAQDGGETTGTVTSSPDNAGSTVTTTQSTGPFSDPLTGSTTPQSFTGLVVAGETGTVTLSKSPDVTLTQQTGPFEPGPIPLTSTAASRTGVVVAGDAGTVTSAPNNADSDLQMTQSVGGMENQESILTGGIIPTAYFHRATGYVTNEDGERITDAVYFIARGDMSVASTVNDDAEFQIYLLNQRYDEFYLLVRSPEIDKEVMWYEAVEQDTAIYPGDENVEVRFQEEAIDVPEGVAPGLIIGSGVSLGP